MNRCRKGLVREKQLVNEETRQASRFQIGDLVLDMGKHEVSRDGRILNLPRLSYQLIVALAKAAPNVVHHDDLVGQVWPGRIVSPETITQRIKLVRQAIGDDAQHPRYVGLVRGEGYRMLANVEPLAPQSDLQNRRRLAGIRPGTVLAFAVVPAVILVAALAIWQSIRSIPVDPQLTRMTAKSIAVLPFVDLSPDQDQRYFADGVAEELLNSLAQLKELNVAGRTSSFSFRGPDQDLKSIGEQLGVTNILEGSVRKEGDSVRITVQLTNVADGFTIWSQSYDRELEKIFEMQEEIATSVAGSLGVRLGVAGVNAFRGAGTQNIEAYEAYLQAHSKDWTVSGVQEAIPLLERAIELDPNYAVAWSMLALRVLSAVWDVSADKAPEVVERAHELALRGVQLNPESAAAHSTLAVVRRFEFDWIGSEQGHTRAITLLADRLMLEQYARMLLRTGRMAYAKEQFGLAQTLEPLGGRPPNLAWHVSLAQGRIAEAKEIRYWQQEVDASLDNILDNLDIAFNEQDPEVLKAGVREMPETNFSYVSLYGPLLTEFDSPERVLSMLKSVYQDEIMQWPRKLHDIAMAAAYFGDAQFALKVKAEEVRINPVRLAAVWYPVMSEVRRLPEFKNFVTELNLVEYWRAYGWADACRPLGDEDFECS